MKNRIFTGAHGQNLQYNGAIQKNKGGIEMQFSTNDAPILIVMGQSNALGHGTKLTEKQRITAPLKNVKGLACDKNQHYNLTDVAWSGYTSHSMNLGETQDDTCGLATEFARKWQAEIDGGNPFGLPDLYVIQIAIGGMGIHAFERDGLNMWYPDRPPVMQPGLPGLVNISLYPLATQILKLAVQNLNSAGKTPRILGLHWNQWETEVDTGGEALRCARENYRRLFNGFREAAGIDFPLYLYRPLTEVYQKPAALREMDALLCGFAAQDSRVHLLDLSKSILFRENRADKGIFQADLIHYSPAAHRWFAEMQFSDLLCDAVSPSES